MKLRNLRRVIYPLFGILKNIHLLFMWKILKHRMKFYIKVLSIGVLFKNKFINQNVILQEF